MKKEKKYLSLDKVQEGLLGILIEFDRVCREYNLCYTLMGGTLLGAVRHKGFIPWDDDIDVLMPRPDYERLYALLHDGTIKLSEHYLFSEDRGKKAPYPFIKMMDDRYHIKSWTHVEVPYLFVDVFPADGVPDLPEKKLAKIHRTELFYNFVVSMTKWYVFSDKWWGYVLRVFLFWFYPIWIIYGKNRAIKKLHKLLLKYPYEEYELCDHRSWGMRKNPVSKKIFDSIGELEFEGHMFCAINDWDMWLTRYYGNYMKLPPESKRKTHNLKVVKTGD